HAAARDRGEIGNALGRDSSLTRALDDGSRQWVFAALLNRTGREKKFLFAQALRGDDSDKARFAFGQGPGLIDDQRVHLLHDFDGFGIADEHTGVSPATDA